MFRYYFKYLIRSNTYKELSEADKEINKVKVDFIKNSITCLKEAIENVPKDDVLKIEENKKIIDIAERILEFNRQQQGQGLKILTPNQTLNRLPISLAQLKAGNNSEKLKIEIRQLLYSVYRSKKVTKNITQIRKILD